MSAILVRPIREQFEHNRVIRMLQSRLRRRFEVGLNLGDEREATGVPSGTDLVYPDLVLTNSEGPRRLHGVVEVETAESVNNLEAMAEWAQLGKVRGAFYLYVPAGTTDVARRLCKDHGVPVTEIWSYHAVGDQMRFTMSYRSARATRAGAAAKRAAKNAKPVKAKAKAKRTSKRGAGPAKQAARATKRTGKAAARRASSAKTTKRVAVRRAARPTPKKSVRKTTKLAKTTGAAKKPGTRAKRGASSGRTTASRPSKSAAGKSAAKSAPKVRTRAGGAGARKAGPSARSRKKR